MEPPSVPDDSSRDILYLRISVPPRDTSLSNLARLVPVSGSALLAKTLVKAGVDRIFCQKEISNTKLVKTLDARGIRIIASPSLGSVLSAATRASRTGRPSIILSHDNNLFNLKFIVPPISSRLDTIAEMILSLRNTVTKIDDIPGMFGYVLHKAIFHGIELELNILPEALLQTVPRFEADDLVDEASVNFSHCTQQCSFQAHSLSRDSETSHIALNHAHNNLTVDAPFHSHPVTHNKEQLLPVSAAFGSAADLVLPISRSHIPSLYRTAHRSATGADVGGLQMLSTAALLQEIQVSLSAQALNSTRIENLAKTEETISSGRGDCSSSSSTSQTALNSVRLGVNPTVLQAAACGYALVQRKNNNLGCFHNACLWIQRRNKQKARFSEAIERELYQEDVYWKQGVPLMGLAVSFMGICLPDELIALKSLSPSLHFLLLGSMVCNGVGRSLKTAFPGLQFQS